ncbi:hypothetical protein LINPERHAP2_LOCUS10138 [Linum perenne]
MRWSSKADMSRRSDNVVTPFSSEPIPRPTLLPTNFQKKIVCDGAFNIATHHGGLEVIMYDSVGRLLDGRLRSFFCGAAICAEAWALLAVVELAASYGERTLIFSDCQTLMKALMDQLDQWPWEAAEIVS